MGVAIKDLKKFAVTVLLLDGIVLVAGLLLGAGALSLLVSLLFGSLFAMANFLLLGSLCEKACTKQPLQAKRFMQINYTIRLFLTAVVIIAAFALPFFNPAGVVVPLFAPKLTYFAGAIWDCFRKKERG